MFGKKTPSKHSELVVVFDVGSGSVGGAIVMLTPDLKREILYTVRKEVGYSPELRGERLLADMLKALGGVSIDMASTGIFGESAQRLFKTGISEVFVFLSAPWHVSQTKLLHFKTPTPTLITEKRLRELLLAEEDDAKASAESAFSTETDLSGALLIEQKIIKAALNGYETSSPYGKTAQEVELGIFLSFSPEEVVRRISQNIEELLHPQRITFHTFSLLFFNAIREYFSAKDNFVCLDVSGELTEVSIATSGAMTETATFPLGRNFLIRRIQKALKYSTPAVAESYLRLYHEGKAEPRFRAAISTAIESAKTEWQSRLISTLQACFKEVFLPTQLFFISDDDVTPIFKDFLESAPLSDYALMPGHLSVSPVTFEHVSTHVLLAESARPDSFLALAALYAKRLFSAVNNA